MTKPYIAVLDFGSQYAHMIAKRLRHSGFYTEIHSPSTPNSSLPHARGLVLSGGPASVSSEDTPEFNAELLNLDLPILGLCYGHQLIAQSHGGIIVNTGKGEYGKAILHKTGDSPLWRNINLPTQVWMSHQDSVTACPPGFSVIGETESGPVAAMQHLTKPVFTFQFHPEVNDTPEGMKLLENFARLCGMKADWSMQTFIKEEVDKILAEVRERKVLMFLSGGVDSSVAFAMLTSALGKERVLGLYMDNGFMRKEETQKIMQQYAEAGFENVVARDYGRHFLESVEYIVDPQEKRRRIGATFIRMRDSFLQELELDPSEWMLGQGTLYPDIIESGGTDHANVIKSHHNRVAEVEQLLKSGEVVEPLKDLYKDEVREVGSLLGLPDSIVWRHPFPGPGLSINVLCADGKTVFPEISKTQQTVRDALMDEATRASVLPVRSVGVQGDQRTYTLPAVLWNTPQDWEWLETQSIRITNTVSEVNRVVTLLAPQSLPDLCVREAYCTRDRLDLLRDAEAIATRALREHHLMHTIFQLLVILLPLSTDKKGDCIVLRPVCSEDVMTAQFARLDWDMLNKLKRELYRLPGINAVFYDITHKPPATFGWE